MSNRKSQSSGERRSRRQVCRKPQRSVQTRELSDAEVYALCLPLRLQDLCQLTLINNLDSYSVHTLSSLPHWVRFRLLENLPALDLYRLDRTPVAAGIDVDKLWARMLPEGLATYFSGLSAPNHITAELNKLPLSARMRNRVDQATMTDEIPEFDLNVNWRYSVRDVASYHALRQSRSNLFTDTLLQLKSAFCTLKREKGNEINIGIRNKWLLHFIGDVLSIENSFGISKLTTIDGKRLLLNLLQDFSCSTIACCSVWSKQSTGLSVQVGHEFSCVMLTPKRLLPQSAEEDPINQLLAMKFATPLTVNLHMSGVSEQIRDALHSYHFTQDLGGSFKTSTQAEACISAFTVLLRRVELLLLRCSTYSEVAPMVTVIRSTFANRQVCTLKYLFCSMPDLYSEIVPTFSHLFTLPNFRQLVLDVGDAHPNNLKTIIQNFMIVPCTSLQTLSITMLKKKVCIGSVDAAQVASLKHGEASVPECAVDHKDLTLSSIQTTGSLLFFLILPTIRLVSLCIQGAENIHLCSLHPDLLVRKLTIMFTKCVHCHGDIVSLLRISTLQEISVEFSWSDKVMLGLTQGFGQRTQLETCPLRKISMTLVANSVGVPKEEVLPLWDAIFSLPEREQLELILYGNVMSDNSVMHESWLKSSSNIKMKSLRFLRKCHDFSYDFLSQEPRDRRWT